MNCVLFLTVRLCGLFFFLSLQIKDLQLFAASHTRCRGFFVLFFFISPQVEMLPHKKKKKKKKKKINKWKFTWV